MLTQKQVTKETSRIVSANKASGSIRATIPKVVADSLGLTVRDIVEWDWVIERGKKYARFRKLE